MRQPLWNKFEAVILLDALLSTIDGTFSRVEAIRNVSIDLRKMAENQDVAANDLYRNENGISFQMHSMESMGGQFLSLLLSCLLRWLSYITILLKNTKNF